MRLKVRIGSRWKSCATVFAMSVTLCSCSNSSTVSTGGNATPTNVMPTGSAVTGATLGGALAGKTVYLLPAAMNPSGCWIDSQVWTGTELFFGVSSIDWTTLNNGSLSYNGACSPSPAFTPQVSPGTTGNFNLYRAQVISSNWVLTNLSLNAGQTVSLSAAKLVGNSVAFVKYEKTASNGNIYLTSRTGDNAFSTPVAFSQNSSACNDDNPVLLAGGNQLIFTSSRATPNGATCGANSLKVFWSSTYSSGAWQTPVALTAPVPCGSCSVDQAWADTTGTNLYWTASGTDCSGLATTCVKTASGSGNTFSGSTTQIITPLSVASWPTTAGNFVSHAGQFSQSGSSAFFVCGISTFVGSSSMAGLTTLNSQSVYAGATSPSPPYYYYHTDFRTCLIQ